jgi:hypothetical protein
VPHSSGPSRFLGEVSLRREERSGVASPPALSKRPAAAAFLPQSDRISGSLAPASGQAAFSLASPNMFGCRGPFPVIDLSPGDRLWPGRTLPEPDKDLAGNRGR